MFGIPSEYHAGIVTDVRKISLTHLKPAERRRFREALKELILEYVVKSDHIPSYVTETDSVMAVQFITVNVDAIRSAPFVCGILQRMIKTPCVLKVRGRREEMYSFALKRLNLMDKGSVVVDDEFLTWALPYGVPSADDGLIHTYASWDTVVNKTNLYSWYTEMMVKCYIITHRTIWSGMDGLLSSKVWYNTEDVMAMYTELKDLVKLTEQRGRSVTISQSAKLNRELRGIYERLRSFIEISN
ncbi:DUF4391 domain-containing protein [Methanocalculus natronophilus]|uniref:DUF4391 domain-containing protein n=1 Tax=Methanocalculus natronophilus TaxID=1262400 RepID=UPI0031B56C96